VNESELLPPDEHPTISEEAPRVAQGKYYCASLSELFALADLEICGGEITEQATLLQQHLKECTDCRSLLLGMKSMMAIDPEIL